MKLRSCHIDNFGKLSDLHLEFQDGVNLFHEPNAWGKSTLAAFLRVMFYGFDSKRESGLFDKERVVFRPWQGGTYGGELDFSYQGKEYRISRTFGKTEKTDVFHLYDLSTNLECHDFSSEIGSEIFGLDSASFLQQQLCIYHQKKKYPIMIFHTILHALVFASAYIMAHHSG